MPKRRAQATAGLSISISRLFHPQKIHIFIRPYGGKQLTTTPF